MVAEDLDRDAQENLRTWFAEARKVLADKEIKQTRFEVARRRSLAGSGQGDQTKAASDLDVAGASLNRLRGVLQTVHEAAVDADSDALALGGADGSDDELARSRSRDEVDEILENLAVDAFLCLLSILLHVDTSRRREALQLLFGLAQALADRRVDSTHFSQALEALGRGVTVFDGVRHAFSVLAPSFAALSTWAVPPLEALLVHPLGDMRMLSVTVMCAFFRSAGAQSGLAQTDAGRIFSMFHMVYGGAAASYESISAQGQRAGSDDGAGRLRATQVDSLEKSVVLASMCDILRDENATPDPNVLARVLRSIVTRPQLMAQERRGARACAGLLAARLIALERAPDIFKSLTLVVSNGLASLTRGDFAALCRCCVQVFPQSVQAKVAVTSFLADMESFLLAPQPVVRYGALLCIHAVIQSIPADILCVQNTALFPLLLSAALDIKPCQALSWECLKLTVSEAPAAPQGSMRGKERAASAAMDARDQRIRKRFRADLCRLQRAVQLPAHHRYAGERADRAGLRDILARAIPLCTGFQEKVFAQLSAGLQYLPTVERLHRMEVLLLWSRKLHHSIPFVANNLLMGIRGADARTGELTVQIFEAMAPTLSSALQARDPAQGLSGNAFYRSLCAIDTVFRQVLVTSQRESLVSRILGTMAVLPYEYFDEARLRLICRTLVARAFTSQVRTRTAIYALLGDCKRVWHTEALRTYVVALMLTCCGDYSAKAALTLCASMRNLLDLKDERDRDLDPVIAALESALRRPFLQSRLRAYTRLVQVLQKRPLHEATRHVMLSHEAFKANANVPRSQVDARQSHWPLFASLVLAQLGSAADEDHAAALLMHCMQTRIQHERELAVDVYFMCLHQGERGVSASLLRRVVLAAFQAMRSWSTKGGALIANAPDGRQSASLLASLLGVLTRIVPLRVKNLAQTLVHFFLSSAADLASRETTEAEVRVACIKLITALLRARPLESTPVAFELRDTLHAMIASSRQDYADAAMQAYPLVFELTSQTRDDAASAFEFLRADLSQFEISSEGNENDDGDLGELSERTSNDMERMPSMQMSKRQAKALTKASLRALGSLRSVSIAPQAIDILLNVIHHPSREFRVEAARSILRLGEMLDPRQSVALRWVIMPLFTDLSAMLLGRAAAGPRSGEGVDQSVLDDAEQDDTAGDENLLFSTPPQSELLAMPIFEDEVAFFPVFAAPRSAILRRNSSARSLASSVESGEGRTALTETAAGSPPNVAENPGEGLSDKLVGTLRAILRSFCGKLIPAQVDLVQYHYFQFVQSTHASLCALLLLGELGVRVFDFEEAEHAAEIHIKSNRFRGILTALLLDSSPDQSIAVPTDRPQRKASAMALRLLGEYAPAKVLPFVIGNLCQLHELKIGHLILLKQIFRIFEASEATARDDQAARPELAELVPSSDAKTLTGLLLRCIQSSSNPVDERRAALELVAQTALLASEQELSLVVRSILEMLEDNSDAAIHKVSQDQLSHVFATFPNDHPLVASLVEHVESGLVSCEVNKRHRSFTLLSIVGRRMGPSLVLPNLIRALCDPTEIIRRLALQSLLCDPPDFILHDEDFVHAIRQLANELELKKAAATRRMHMDMESEQRGQTGLPTAKGNALDFEDLEEDEEPARSPRAGAKPGSLQDEDPLNLNFLQRDTMYLHYLAQYGLSAPAAGLEASELGSGAGEDDEAQASYEGPRNAFDLPEAAFAGLLSCDVGLIMLVIMGRHARVGERLLEGIQMDLEFGKSLISRSQKRISEMAPDDLDGEYLGYGELEMDQLLHSFTVNMTILSACDGLPGTWPSIVPALQTLVLECTEIASVSRLLASAKMNLISLVASEKLHLPVVSVEEFASLETQRASLLAQLGSEKQHKLIATKKDALQRQLRALSTHLWVVTKLQGVLLGALGNVYKHATVLGDETIADGLHWLLEQLGTGQHRGLRSLTSHAIVNLSTRALCSEDFRKRLDTSLVDVHERLQQSRPGAIEDNLRRAKVELLETFVRLLPRCSAATAKKLLQSTFKLLVSLWDDGDSQVRQTAIALTEELARHGSSFPELQYILFDKNTVNLREEIAKRTADPAYPNHDQLSKLLQWTQQPHS